MSNGDRDRLLATALGLGSGGSPFPWQRILLGRFMEGRIPVSLDIPTGLGKTGTMAVWLIARCAGAPIPRRLVYVVDRRVVVDQATRDAEALREWLESHPEQKEAAGLEPGQVLPISTLRGRFVDNQEWLEDPSRPAIIVGTVDMVGSRLLFEGYGVSRKMRPYHAGLLGCDTLVVLDEAHLVPPFQALLTEVARREDWLAGAAIPDDFPAPGLRLLSLSATGRTIEGDTLRLDEDEGDPDRENDEVRRRILADKRLTLHDTEGDALEKALAERAWDLSEAGTQRTRVVVYCNSRQVAETVADDLESRVSAWMKANPDSVAPQMALLVGARRVRERSIVADELHDLGFAAKPQPGAAPATDAPAFLIATSAGEVGVDLDAQHMVSDLVEWDRMVQRLGRVNRRGRGMAEVHVYVEALPEKATGKQETAHTARRALLEGLRPEPGGGLDASPDSLAERTEQVRGTDILREGSTERPLRPALDRATVEAWSATSLKEHTGRPPVEPWLRGWVDDRPQTTVAFRASLPSVALPLGEYARYFEAAPVHASEVLETETWRVAEWLFARAKAIARRLSKSQETPDSTPREPTPSAQWAFLLDPAGELTETWSIDDLVKVAKQDKKSRDRWQRGLFGHTLVVDAAIGGLNRGLLSPSMDDVPPTADGEGDWLRPMPSGDPVVPFRAMETTSADPLIDGNWHERVRIALTHDEDGDEARWLVIQQWKHGGAFEEARSSGPPQKLTAHQDETMKVAAALADRLALPERLSALLVLAARLHDEGKRADRWQRAFSALADGPYAKTRGPLRLQHLGGYRHEFGSLGRVVEDPEFVALAELDRDLVLHLVAAHHGFARPLLRADGCEDAPPSRLSERSRDVALRFYRLQERFGPWGLAWLESLLRAADQQASRGNAERQNPKKQGPTGAEDAT